MSMPLPSIAGASGQAVPALDVIPRMTEAVPRIRKHYRPGRPQVFPAGIGSGSRTASPA